MCQVELAKKEQIVKQFKVIFEKLVKIEETILLIEKNDEFIDAFNNYRQLTMSLGYTKTATRINKRLQAINKEKTAYIRETVVKWDK